MDPYLGSEEIDPRNPKNHKKSLVFETDSFTNPGAKIQSASAPNDDDGEDSSSPSTNKFTTLNGVAAPLDIQNIDTDMIIPKEFLKTIKRAGLGFAAFAELRYKNPEEVATIGEEVAILEPTFVLNQPEYKGAQILLVGDNFGCGSSREHAPWSIEDMGIRCIISTSFADIFYNNCFNNGMLPVTLPRDQIEALLEDASVVGTEVVVDLINQKVIRPNGEEFSFEIDAFRKRCLVDGIDKIGLTLEKEGKISGFEATRSARYPWLDGASFRVPHVVPMYPEAEFWKVAA